MKYLIMSLSLAGFFISQSFASPEYSNGIRYSVQSLGDSALIITGTVDAIIENAQVTMRITDSDGKLILVAKTTPVENGNFAFNVTKRGPLWQNVTDYSIILNYQKPDTNSVFDGRDIGSSREVFLDVIEIPKALLSPLQQFKSGIALDKIQCNNELHVLTKRPNEKMACVHPLTAEKLGWKIINADSTLATSIFEVPKDDGIFDVGYGIRGGVVKYMVLKNNTNSLLVTIDSTDNGSLILSIPRSLLDARFDYCPPHQINPPDDRFIVLLDREEAVYDEIQTTPEKRTLQIQFTKNAAEIEVIAACLI
ncbi:MAG: hypothetical protein HZA84_02560 [Thaumarchaeota archaeon]|nr:hypothetical protein [Nitrososphaerota archaeon]